MQIYLSEVTPEGRSFWISLPEKGKFCFVLRENKRTSRKRQTPHFYRLSFSEENGITTVAKNGEILNKKATPEFGTPHIR